MKKVNLRTILTVIPLLSACLYLIGVNYHQGYLNGFGIEDSLFQLATDRSLFLGFISLILHGYKPVLYSCVFIGVLAIVTILAAALSSSEWIKQLQAKFLGWFKVPRLNLRPSPTMDKLVDKGVIIYFHTITLAMLFVAFLVIALVSHEAGRGQSEREIINFSNDEGGYVLLEEMDRPSPVKGLQITCGVSHCAFWLGKEALVLKHERVVRVTAYKLQ